METTEKEQKKILSTGRINGTWQLTYSLINDLGIDGFSGRMLSSYIDPLTGRERFLVNLDGRRELGFWIDKQQMNLFPTNNPWHARVIDWLVGHPEVGIEVAQTELAAQYMSRKSSNPRIKLLNLDHQDIEYLEEEDFVDKLVGTISMDTGQKAISLEKLRWVLAKMNYEYRNAKYINNPKIEKQKLRQTLKKFIRSSYENAQKVDAILEKLEEAKFAYEIKEMLRVAVMTNSGGMFMFQGNPLGTSFESLVAYFNNNPELYADLLGQLAEKQRAEAN